jgi:hypothetical protein
MSATEHALGHLSGAVALATDRANEGTTVDRSLALAPWSGVVLER